MSKSPLPPSRSRKECVHDWEMATSFKSKKEVRPLDAFKDPYYIDTTVVVRDCKKCKLHEVNQL